MSKVIPEIRFKGFNSEWTSNKLGDVINISSASRVHKEEWKSEGVPFFRSSDVISRYMKKYNDPAFISYALYQELSEKSGKVKAEDLLVTGGGTIGIPYLIENEDPLYFKDADLIWLKNSGVIDGRFLYNFFLSPQTRRYISSITHIGTISHYTIEQGKNTPISLPVKSEQEKIGTLLNQLDVTIALQQQLVEQQQQYKKAMLQKMFPQIGERVPKVRFDGFSGDWEEKKLGDVSNITKLAGFEFTNYITYSNSGEIPAIRGLNVKKGQFVFDDTKYIDTSDFSKLNRSKLFHNDIVFTYVGTIGEAAIVPPNVNWYLAPNVSRIRTEKIDSNFLLQVLMNPVFKRKEIDIWISTSSQPALSMENIRKFRLMTPLLNEQQKIGTFFKQLDDKISLHKKKLEDYQQLKKALLQRMFV